MATSGSEAPKANARWLILVAADQRELYEHLQEVFEADRLVKVVLDRRTDERRTPEWLRRSLRERGAVVIPAQA
jgi:anti-sigma factor RsiW